MQPTSNGFHKPNGRVSPMDDETAKKLAKTEINNTFLVTPNDPVEPTKEEVTQKSFIYRLFKKDQKEKPQEKEVEKKKQPEAPKLKSFEIVCVT